MDGLTAWTLQAPGAHAAELLQRGAELRFQIWQNEVWAKPGRSWQI